MSPASAARSAPMPPSAIPASAWARAGASLMPSPTIATRRPACRRSAIQCALSAGSSSAMNRLGVHLLGDGPRHRLAIAGQDRDLLDLQVPQVVNHVMGFGPDRVVNADHSRDFAVDRHDERRLSPRVEVIQNRLDRRIDDRARLRRAAAGCRPGPDGLRSSPAAHWPGRPRRASTDGVGRLSESQRPAPGLGDHGEGQRMPARRLRPTPPAASTSSAGRSPVDDQPGELGNPWSVFRSCRTRTCRTAARPSTAEPPLIKTPCRASQAMLASIAAGVASTNPHGHATTSTATTRDQTSGQPAR